MYIYIYIYIYEYTHIHTYIYIYICIHISIIYLDIDIAAGKKQTQLLFHVPVFCVIYVAFYGKLFLNQIVVETGKLPGCAT